MKSRIKEILLCLFILFLVLAVRSQEPLDLASPPPAAEDDGVCGLRFHIVQINVSVWSNKEGYLKDLTYKDFKIYDEKELQEIDTFEFDELKNQYTVGYYPTYFVSDAIWREIKVEVKLSKTKKVRYGDILVNAPNGYYPNQN